MTTLSVNQVEPCGSEECSVPARSLARINVERRRGSSAAASGPVAIAVMPRTSKYSTQDAANRGVPSAFLYWSNAS